MSEPRFLDNNFTPTEKEAIVSMIKWRDKLLIATPTGVYEVFADEGRVARIKLHLEESEHG